MKETFQRKLRSVEHGYNEHTLNEYKLTSN